MPNKYIPALKLIEVDNFLDETLTSFIANHKGYLGQMVSIKGRLVNVVQCINNSRYSLVYNLILEDESGKIEIEIEKNLLNGFENGSFVAFIGQPKFNFYNSTCTKRFRAYSISAIQLTTEIQALQSKLENLDALKQFLPKSNLFPNAKTLTIALVFSKATNVRIHDDFYKPLTAHRTRHHFIEMQVSLSDVSALASTIKKANECDVVVLIRGGGKSEDFKIFNTDQILQVFSELDNYRIIGLGHNTDIGLLDYLADHSAYTPLDAGLHLNEQLNAMKNRYSKIGQQEQTIESLEKKLNFEKNKISQLSRDIEKRPTTQEFNYLREENSNLKFQVDSAHSNHTQKSNSNLIIIGLIFLIIGVFVGRLLL